MCGTRVDLHRDQNTKNYSNPNLGLGPLHVELCLTEQIGALSGLISGNSLRHHTGQRESVVPIRAQPREDSESTKYNQMSYCDSSGHHIIYTHTYKLTTVKFKKILIEMRIDE